MIVRLVIVSHMHIETKRQKYKLGFSPAVVIHMHLTPLFVNMLVVHCIPCEHIIKVTANAWCKQQPNNNKHLKITALGTNENARIADFHLTFKRRLYCVHSRIANQLNTEIPSFLLN
mgnify:FL=1